MKRKSRVTVRVGISVVSDIDIYFYTWIGYLFFGRIYTIFTEDASDSHNRPLDLDA